MAIRRDATCLLCGARLTPLQVLDACDEFADTTLGALACCCPHCQGRFDVLLIPGWVRLGYVRHGRFDTVVSLAADGLEALPEPSGGGLRVRLDGKTWTFTD